MSKSQGASSVIPGPSPNKSGALRLLANPEPLRVPQAFDESSVAEERTIVSAISRDMLGLTDDGAAATKTYEVPRELLELARARAKAQKSDRPPLTLEEFAALAAPTLAPPALPTDLAGAPESGERESVGALRNEAPSTLPPELEASEGAHDALSAEDAAVEEVAGTKPSRKFIVTKWVVLAGVYLAICYCARVWLPLP